MLASILLFFEILLYCGFLIGTIFCGFVLLIFAVIAPIMFILILFSGIIYLYEWLHKKYKTLRDTKKGGAK